MNSHDLDKDLSTRNPEAERARELFERASERLDLATANRLRLARRDAQAATALRKRSRALLPIGAAAATMLAVGLAWWLPREQASVHAPLAIEAAQDAYIADDDAEVYAWLGEAPVATSDGNNQDEKAGAL